MAQNRNKLIDLFIGNFSNAVLHAILEKAADHKEYSGKYRKESLNSLEIAKKYRDKINPAHAPLPEKDMAYVRNKIINKIKAELRLRIAKGYDNLDVHSVENDVDKLLKNADI